MKKIFIIILIIIAFGLAIFFEMDKKQTTPLPQNPTIEQPQIKNAFDPKNSSFKIENAPITLVNGFHQVELASIPGAKITTRYFGDESFGDLNFDGKEDIAFLVTQDGGGSGLFYYAVVALKTETGYTTTNAFYVGDRIAPQGTEIKSQTGELRIYFAERKKGEPMSTQPSQGAVLLLKVTKQGILEGLMK